MKIYKLKSPYPCLVKNKEEEVELSPNETIETEGKVYIYPLDASILPFVINTQKLSPSNRYDILEERGLIFLRDKVICENYFISKLNISGENCTFEIGENKIVILYKNFKKIVNLDNHYDTYNTGYKKHIAYIHLKGKDETLYALNTKSGKMKRFCGKEIDITNDSFVVKNETEHEYKITAEGLVGSIQTSFHTPSTNETVAYHFLNALKYGDLESAYTLLSPALQDKISKSSLKSYFGNIASFYTLSPYEYAVKSETLLLYTFEIKDRLIVDIDQ